MIKIEPHPVNMIKESGYVVMLFRTIIEQKKDLWRVIVAHFSFVHSPSKGHFKVSSPYLLKLPTISWPTFLIGPPVAQISLHHLWL